MPEPDVDQELTLAALRKVGFEPEMVAWDAETDFSQFRAAVLRSTWDYPWRYEEFCAALKGISAQTELINPLETVLWNSHKRYLLEVAEAGFAIVPTLLIEKDGRIEKLDGASVVKPAVGAGSWETKLFDERTLDSGVLFANSLAERMDVLVQPVIRSVYETGERSLMVIGGKFSHAIRKFPRFSDDHENVQGPIEVSADEVSSAEAVCARFGNECIYARVDVMDGEDGRLLLSELELIEPSLFFLQEPAAADRFALALNKRLVNSG